MGELNESRKAKVLELRKKNPDRKVAIVVTGGRDFYVRSPSRVEWHQFKDAFLDSKRRRAAMENLACSCCLDPAPEVVRHMIDTTDPALGETLAEKIGLLGGYDDSAELLDFPET